MSTEDRLPLVTIAIPLYNHAQYVGECLDSIAEEGYPELELVIVDDGSKDDSHAVAAAWIAANGARFRRCVLLQQENRGICPTLNRLIGQSKGEFILAIASDDRLRAGGIRPRVQLLLDNPRALAVMSNTRIIDEAGNVLTDDGFFQYFKLSRARMLDPLARPAEILLKSVSGPILMVRTSAYLGPDGIGLYDETFSFEDRDFLLRVLARPDGLLFLDECVADYRVHPGNHVGGHVQDKERYRKLIRDYVAMGRKNAPLYHGALRVAIQLDALEAKLQRDPGRSASPRQRLRTPVRKLKQLALALHGRKARRHGGA